MVGWLNFGVKIFALEPYYGSSRKAFLDGCLFRAAISVRIQPITLQMERTGFIS
jgi:hypothetical protein